MYFRSRPQKHTHIHRKIVQVPKYDVLVTNPPYSGDHMERLLRFARESQKPFLLLLPTFVAAEKYYSNLAGGIAAPSKRAATGPLVPTRRSVASSSSPSSASSQRRLLELHVLLKLWRHQQHPGASSFPLLLCPRTRYQYWTPHGLRGPVP